MRKTLYMGLSEPEKLHLWFAVGSYIPIILKLDQTNDAVSCHGDLARGRSRGGRERTFFEFRGNPGSCSLKIHQEAYPGGLSEHGQESHTHFPNV